MPAGGSTGPVPGFFSRHVRDARRFYLELAPPADTPLAVVCAGRETCTPEYAIRRESFPYLSVEFVARGRGALLLAGRPHPLTSGTVFAYGPGVSQEIATDAEDPLTKYFVDFAGTRGPGLLQNAGLAPGQVAHVLAPGPLRSAFDSLIHEGVQARALAPSLCAALLEYVILKIADLQVPGQSGSTQAYATYERCRQHIVEHASRLRSLDEIARECHLDRAYLCRLFRRYDHQTPHQFLMRTKMNLAAERLHDTRLLVKQVAAELGFDDPYHFSRTFKRVFGLSPDAFRRLR
jgi:AraC-like DNA-binding protein